MNTGRGDRANSGRDGSSYETALDLLLCERGREEGGGAGRQRGRNAEFNYRSHVAASFLAQSTFALNDRPLLFIFQPVSFPPYPLSSAPLPPHDIFSTFISRSSSPWNLPHPRLCSLYISPLLSPACALNISLRLPCLAYNINCNRDVARSHIPFTSLHFAGRSTAIMPN